HPRRRMQISTACNPAVRKEGRPPLVPCFEIFADQGAMRIPSDVFLAVKLGDTSPVRKMLAVIEGTKGNPPLTIWSRARSLRRFSEVSTSPVNSRQRTPRQR